MKNSPLRGEDIRLKNEKLILKKIYQSKGISQSEIVNFTGLKAPTVLRIFTLLEEKGLIQISTGNIVRNSDKKGRKPVFYSVVPKAHYIIGIEFWSEEAHVLLVDFDRNPLFSKQISLKEYNKASDVLKQLNLLIEESIVKTKIDREKILGIGIGAPGRINVETGEVINYERIQGFKDFPLAALVGAQFPYPVILNNNAGVTAMDAFKRGEASKSKALFTFLIRQGVGGAFIHNGQLFNVLGKTSFEIGHTTVIPDGKDCPCGSQGCLESYISESALLESFQKDFPSYKTLDQVEKDIPKIPDLKKIIQREGKYLALCAKNLSRILAPDSFLIITRYKTISKLLAEVIRECIFKDCFLGETPNIKVFSDVYSPEQAGLGACDLILNHFFQI